MDGTILPGVTRRSVIHIAKERLGLEVEEKKIELKEALEADEAFASGTAEVISPIGLINHDGKDYILSNNEVGANTRKIY